jgi:ParB-like chromosome segregation protein Spo0J
MKQSETALVMEARRLHTEVGLMDTAIARRLKQTRHWVRKHTGSGTTHDGSTSAAKVVAVPLMLISASPNSRPVRDTKVAALVESIGQVGLIEPVILRRFGDGYETIAGGHRVEAFRRLEHESIPALVREADDLTAELMLIDENLCRNEFSPAERAMAISRRKAIYLELHPETKAGKSQALGMNQKLGRGRQVGDDVERFTLSTTDATGIAERTIQRDAARGERLGTDTLKRIVGTSLDKGEELDALAKLSEPKREELIERAAAGKSVTAKHAVKQEIRNAKEADLGDKLRAGNLVVPDQKFAIILCDWPRKPLAWSEETGFDRAPDNHYATQTFRWAIDELAPMIRKLAAPDAMLVFWTTAASLLDDIEIMAEAGFCALRQRDANGLLKRDGTGEPLPAISVGGGTYRSHQVWDKETRGTGRWFIERHELVLLGVRGSIPCPAPGTQSLSIFSERRGDPSAKPEFIAAEIDRLWPNLPKVELFRRGAARPGWAAWGAEVPALESVEAEKMAGAPCEVAAGQGSYQSPSGIHREAEHAQPAY